MIPSWRDAKTLESKEIEHLMKIAHIAPPWITIPPKGYGGTESVIYYLVEELVTLGHDVTLFAPADAKTSAKLVSFYPLSLREEGVPWQGHLKAFYHLYKAVEYAKTHCFDIVHVHLSSSADMYVFPLVTSLATPIIATLHTPFPFDYVQSWTGDADKYYLEWLSRVPTVAISQSVCAQVPHPLQFIDVVHHGLPMDVLKPMVEHPENFLVWLGRITPEKGTHLAIEAAKAAHMPLVLAGTVDSHLTVQVTYFEEMIKPHIDQQQIKYIGPVNAQQKIDLLSRAWGMLNPIQWEEPFGIVMLEAMSVGCPVIAIARGAAPEIISHGTSGFLVQDVQEMIQYVPRLGELDRRKVRAHAEQNFSTRMMAEKYVKVYKRAALALREPSPPKVAVKARSVSALSTPLRNSVLGFKAQELSSSASGATTASEVEEEQL